MLGLSGGPSVVRVGVVLAGVRFGMMLGSLLLLDLEARGLMAYGQIACYYWGLTV
jgi:hypothetical protein